MESGFFYDRYLVGNAVFDIRDTTEIRLEPKRVIADYEPDHGLDFVIAIQKFETLNDAFSFVQNENAYEFVNVRLSSERNIRKVKSDVLAL